jgi:hypothetical protein
VSVYAPENLPILVSLLTIPDNGHDGFAYEASFRLSTPNQIVQFYAPPDDLFACFPVTIHRGSFRVPFSFVLAPSAHLVLVAEVATDTTQGQVFLQGTVSGNVSFG